MKAVVEICPFQRTTTLAEAVEAADNTLETGIKNLADKMGVGINSQVLAEFDHQMMQLINAAQNETIRSFVCPVCDQFGVCTEATC